MAERDGPKHGNPLRALPPVQRLLEGEAAAMLAARHGRGALVAALRAVLEELRGAMVDGAVVPGDAEIVASAGVLLAARARPGFARVINATGIVLHTNLGRAPLAAEAIAAVAEAARSYCNVEFDLSTGLRGSRTAAIEPLLREVAGAEAALAVNNGAAAILLALSGLAGGGEVVVSRGELVEIGGGFRVPDVIAQGGARLVEVGSTNKTRLADYRAAITPQTRVLLKVHQSNFRTIGFTQEVGIGELVGLAREFRLLVVVDLGSGLLARVDGCDEATRNEPTLREALAAGADVVTCSGDKLLGGPQAGLIVGREAAVSPLRRHPLLRAVRLDKMSLAALEATLRLHRDRPGHVPVMRMLASDEAALAARAERLRALVGVGDVVASGGFAGGGSLPEQKIASRALALAPASLMLGGVEAAAAALRGGHPAVVGRIAEGHLLLDVLTVADDEVDELAGAVRAVLG